MIDSFLNINSMFDYAVYRRNGTRFNIDDLSAILPPSLAETELSRERRIAIPTDLQALYRCYRPTPLFRAREFEKAIGTDCEIYIKDEGATPSGNHKVNSALYICHMCARDGVKVLTTETTGNWGIALAKAAKELGIHVVCFMDAESHRVRPDRKSTMENAGATVVIVELDSTHGDLLSLSADAAIQHTQQLEDAAYIFGSVYGYFLTPQSLVGLEAKSQLAGLSIHPDIVVGSCGGGANLLGISAPFIEEHVENRHQVQIFSAEAAACPIVTKGVFGTYGIETLGGYPLLETYGLSGLVNDGNYIGGLGSTIVASAVAHFHQQGIIKGSTFTADQAEHAGNLFRKSEGRRVALETCYQLAGIIQCCQYIHRGTILTSISSVPENEAA